MDLQMRATLDTSNAERGFQRVATAMTAANQRAAQAGSRAYEQIDNQLLKLKDSAQSTTFQFDKQFTKFRDGLNSAISSGSASSQVTTKLSTSYDTLLRKMQAFAATNAKIATDPATKAHWEQELANLQKYGNAVAQTITKTQVMQTDMTIRAKNVAAQAAGVPLQNSEKTVNLFKDISSAAQGVMMGTAAAQGNIMGMAFGLIFLRFTEVGIMAATASLTVALIGLKKAILDNAIAAVKQAVSFENMGQQMSSYLGSVEKATAVLRQADEISQRVGWGREENAKALTQLERYGIRSQTYISAIANAAAATGETFGKVTQDFMETIKKSGSGGAEAVKRFAQDYGLEIKNYTNSLQLAEAINRRFAGAAANRAQTVEAMLERLRNGWESALSRAGAVGAEALKPLLELLMAFVNGFAQGANSAIEMGKASGETAQTISDLASAVRRATPLITWFGSLIGRAVVFAIQLFTQSLKGIINAVSLVLQKLKMLGDLFRGLSQWLKDNWAWALAAAAGILALVTNLDLLGKIKDFLIKVGVELIDKIPNLIEWAQGMSRQAEKALKDAFSAGDDAMDAIVDWFKRAKDKWDSTAKDFTVKIKIEETNLEDLFGGEARIKAGTQKILRNFEVEVETQVNGFGDRLGIILKEAWDKGFSNFLNTVKPVSDTGLNIVNMLKGLFSPGKLADAIGDYVVSEIKILPWEAKIGPTIGDRLDDAIDSGAKRLVQGTGKALSAIKNAIGSLFSKGIEVGVAEGAEEAASGGLLNAITQSFEKMLANIKSGIGNLFKGFGIAVFGILVGELIKAIADKFLTVEDNLKTRIFETIDNAVQAVLLGGMTAGPAGLIAGGILGIFLAGLEAAFPGINKDISTRLEAAIHGIVGILGSGGPGIARAWEIIWEEPVKFWNSLWGGGGKKGLVQQSWDDFWKNLGDGINNLGYTVAAPFMAVWENQIVRQWNDWFGDNGSIKAIWVRFWAGVGNVMATVGNALAAAWSAVWDNGIVAVWNSWFGENGTVKLAWDNFWKMIGTALDTAGTALSAAWNAIWSAIVNAWNLIFGDTGSLKSSWISFWEGVHGEVLQWTQPLAETWQALWDQIVNAWTFLFGDNGIVTNAWNAFWGMIQTIETAAGKVVDTIWQGIWGGITSWWQENTKKFDTDWNAMWTKIGQTSDSMGKIFRGAWESFWNDVQSLWNGIYGAGGTFLDAYKTFWQNLHSKIDEEAPKLVDKWKGFWDEKKSWWMENIDPPLRKAWTDLLAQFSQETDNHKAEFTNAWNPFWDERKSWWHDNIEVAFQDSWPKLLNFFPEQIRNIETTLAGVWTGLWNALGESLHNWYEEKKQAWINFWNYLRDHIKDGNIFEAINPFRIVMEQLEGLMNKVRDVWNFIQDHNPFNAMHGNIQWPIQAPQSFASGGRVSGAPGGPPRLVWAEPGEQFLGNPILGSPTSRDTGGGGLTVVINLSDSVVAGQDAMNQLADTVGDRLTSRLLGGKRFYMGTLG
jgi:hypothetical protein